MSAIAGLFRTDHQPAEAETAERMAAALGRGARGDEPPSYRSPGGSAALATSGAPLLVNESHDVWLVLDGEIVNHRPLRHTLELLGHRFRSGNSAEVAVHAYEEWGLDFPAHLHGAFALALWDDRRDRLVLARDRLGRKPLYFASHRGRLGFASGIAALLSELELPRRLDPLALAQYLRLGCVPAPMTLVAGVSALAAGEILVAGRDGGPHRHRWRELLPAGGPVPPLRGLPPDRHAGNLRTLLECAVADRIGGDGRLGVRLSSDPAAGAVAAIVTRLTGVAPSAVAVGDDAGLAALRPQASAAGVEPVELRPSAGDAAAALPGLVAALTAPVAGPDLLSGWFASEALGQMRARLLLAPVGAGQVLLNEAAYAPLRPRGWRRLLRWLAAPARALPQPLFGDDAAGLFALALPQAVPPLPAVPAWLDVDALAVAGLDDLTVTVADGAAPALDAVAQCHGLTARQPFLDEALVDYMLVVPGRVRAQPRVLGDLVPGGWRGRRQSAALPLGQWLAGPLGDLLLDRAERWPLLDHAAVAALLRAHRADPTHGDRLWALLVLAEWCLGLGLEDVAPAEAGAEMVYSRS